MFLVPIGPEHTCEALKVVSFDGLEPRRLMPARHILSAHMSAHMSARRVDERACDAVRLYRTPICSQISPDTSPSSLINLSIA